MISSIPYGYARGHGSHGRYWWVVASCFPGSDRAVGFATVWVAGSAACPLPWLLAGFTWRDLTDDAKALTQEIICLRLTWLGSRFSPIWGSQVSSYLPLSNSPSSLSSASFLLPCSRASHSGTLSSLLWVGSRLFIPTVIESPESANVSSVAYFSYKGVLDRSSLDPGISDSFPFSLSVVQPFSLPLIPYNSPPRLGKLLLYPVPESLASYFSYQSWSYTGLQSDTPHINGNFTISLSSSLEDVRPFSNIFPPAR